MAYEMRISDWSSDGCSYDLPDEHVVDREALLGQVAGDVLTGGLAAPGAPHGEREGEADRDPDRGLDRRLLGGDDVSGLVDQEQVGDEQDHDDCEERAPHPEVHVEVGEVLLGGALRGEGRDGAEGCEQQLVLWALASGGRRRQDGLSSGQPRSEEHTSELKSLMRNSYA